MKTIKKKVPYFKTYKEEAAFWDTHSVADFKHEMIQVKTKFARNLSQSITIRFDKPTLDSLRNIAHSKGVGPTTLTRMWILEHLQHRSSS